MLRMVRNNFRRILENNLPSLELRNGNYAAEGKSLVWVEKDGRGGGRWRQ